MKIKKTGINLYLIILFFYLIFGRTFSGIGFFGFKIGEILIAVSLFFSVCFFPIGKLKVFEDYFIFDKKIFYASKLFLVSFLLTIFMTNGNLLDTYTYRSSSIIWSINFLFFGYFVFAVTTNNNSFYSLLTLVPVILYILSTVHFPPLLIEFFNNYSDKFDFVKGSDLLLAFVVVLLFLRNRYNKTFFSFTYFVFLSALYLPLFLYKSKGAFFPGIILVICNVFFYKTFIRNNILKSISILAVSTLIFFASAFNSYGNLTFKKLGMDGVTQPENIVVAVPDALTSIVSEKNTNEIFASFFINNGRLYSQEQMANWRLQIWQDTVMDLFWYANYYQDTVTYQLVREQLERRNDIFMTGFGYNEILPSMDHWERQGTDGSNENPHNFLIYSLGRGGLLLGILVISFHVLILLYWYKKFKNFQILFYMLPVLFAAAFDAALESVRYPFIYYSFLGYFINHGIKK